MGEAEKILEVLECIEAYGYDDCRKLYPEYKDLIDKAELCEEHCYYNELEDRMEGDSEEWDKWCRENCVPEPEWW